MVSDSKRWDSEDNWHQWCAEWFRTKAKRLGYQVMLSFEGLEGDDLEDKVHQAVLASCEPGSDYVHAYHNAFVHSKDGKWWIGFGDGETYLPTGFDVEEGDEDKEFERFSDLLDARGGKQPVSFDADFDETFPDKAWMRCDEFAEEMSELIEDAVSEERGRDAERQASEDEQTLVDGYEDEKEGD